MTERGQSIISRSRLSPHMEEADPIIQICVTSSISSYRRFDLKLQHLVGWFVRATPWIRLFYHIHIPIQRGRQKGGVLQISQFTKTQTHICAVVNRLSVKYEEISCTWDDLQRLLKSSEMIQFDRLYTTFSDRSIITTFVCRPISENETHKSSAKICKLLNS